MMDITMSTDDFQKIARYAAQYILSQGMSDKRILHMETSTDIADRVVASYCRVIQGEIAMMKMESEGYNVR